MQNGPCTVSKTEEYSWQLMLSAQFKHSHLCSQKNSANLWDNDFFKIWLESDVSDNEEVRLEVWGVEFVPWPYEKTIKVWLLWVCSS